MNRLSVIFVSSLVAACAAEGSPVTWAPPQADGAPGSMDPGAHDDVISPGCLPDGDAVRLYGTALHDGFRDVAITAGGEVLIAGYQGGLERPTGEVVGTRAVVLAYEGTFIPRAVIDTLGTDVAESIAIEPDSGRTWLALRTDGELPGLPGYGGFDMVLAELDGGGARMLARGHDGTPEYPRQLAAGAGLVAIAGHEERLMADGATWVNPVLSVFATGGSQPTWSWRITRRTSAIQVNTAVDVADDTIVIASAIATGNEQGAYVMARNADADLLWQHRLSITGGDTIAAVRIVEGGDVVWAGTSNGDVVAGRIDGATGTPRWTTRHGDDRDERAADLAVDDRGRILIAGDSAASESDQRDAFLLVLDDEGRAVAEEVWTSDGDDVPAAIAVDACGSAVIVGTTTGDLGGAARGGDDAFLIVTSASAE